jgi:alanine racemase
VVKADAYGHNAVLVSKYLQELDFIESFCVATPLEGKKL